MAGGLGRSEKLRVVTVKLPEWMVDMLDTMARFAGVSRSEIVRRAVDEFIDRHYDEYTSVKPKVIRILG